MKTIDLRSDTGTRPTPAMRRAMAEAEVGDDFYRDDSTVRALETMVDYDGEPNGLKFHADGRLFVADYKNGLMPRALCGVRDIVAQIDWNGWRVAVPVDW